MEWLTDVLRGLWSGVDENGCAPSPAGLDRYEVVPDAQAGKLGQGQITQSQHDELVAFGFDQMQVTDDCYAGDIAPDQMTQWEYDQMQMAWLCMAANSDAKDADKGDNLGITLDGEAADQARFKQMLAAGLGRSDVFRKQFLAMGNDRSVNLTFDVTGSGDALVDQFEGHDGLHGTRGIHGFDLDDLAVFPDQAPAEFPEAMTRGEILLHGISEAYRGARSTIADDPSYAPDPSQPSVTVPWFKRYLDAHEHAIELENAYRAEQGQGEKRDDANIGTVRGGTGVVMGTHAEYWKNDGRDLSAITYLDPATRKFRAPAAK